MIDHHGKTALVTGGASGIGKALASALKARGATVILADIDAATLGEAAAELGTGTHSIPCDLAHPDAPARLIEEAYRITGRVDLVCSNAGIGNNRRLRKQELDDKAARLLDVNLFAGLRLAQRYLSMLESRGARGRMLFTASENSLSVPSAVRGMGLGLYAATKHALLILLEWLRDETREGAVDLHVLLPGAVYTPLVARNLPDPAMAPPGLHLIQPERCAEVALAGMDLGLFYIPTQRHLLDDMQPRMEGIRAAIDALGL